MKTPTTKKKVILDLCGGTGAWSEPYRRAGYDVGVITLPHYDIRTFLESESVYAEHVRRGDVYGILAAPPCTMFSMARTVAKTPRDLKGAMDIVSACLRIIWAAQYNGKRLAFWALENPKARLRWFLGQPALTFNPYDFGDAYRKPTDIWGNFNTDLKRSLVKLDKTKKKQSQLNVQDLLPIPKEYVRDPAMSPRAIARSITHPGFAQAFFTANQ
jgi:hypothetical protein